MTAREDAIEAGAQALHGDECPDDEHDLCDVGAWDRAAAAVVDAVEPIIRADERERLADLVQMKFSMTSARSHDDTCVCILCAINSTVDAAVDFIRGGESGD